MCRASRLAAGPRRRRALPPPRSHRPSRPVPVPGKRQPCADDGAQPRWSPAPRGPLSRRQMACRLLDDTSPSPVSWLWPGVPAHVAAEGRESTGSSRVRASGSQELGTGEPPTHAQTLPPPQHHHRGHRSLPGPQLTAGRRLSSSAQCLCLKDSAFPCVPSPG